MNSIRFLFKIDYKVAWNVLEKYAIKQNSPRSSFSQEKRKWQLKEVLLSVKIFQRQLVKLKKKRVLSWMWNFPFSPFFFSFFFHNQEAWKGSNNNKSEMDPSTNLLPRAVIQYLSISRVNQCELPLPSLWKKVSI